MIIRFFSHVTTFIFKRPKATLLLGLILGLVSLPFAIKLYANLHSGIEELLPKSAPSIKALDVLRTRLGDNLQLTMLVSGVTSEQLHNFADKLALEAKTIPSPNKPRFIDYRPSDLQDFFKNRKLLFISLNDLKDAEEAVRYKVTLLNPLKLLGFGDDEAPKNANFDFEKMLSKYESKAERIPFFPTGYYENESRDSIVVIFYPAKGVTGFEGSSNFKEAIDIQAKKVAASLNLPQIKIEYSGDVESIIQEQKSLESDLFYSTTVVLLLESLLIFSFFRWFPSVITLGIPLIIGVLITFAISYFAVGSVNLTTAFLGSIIIGNGVNAGIILLARFLEERRNGIPSIEAMSLAVINTWRFTLAASGAAALAYASLMITSFRGYSQFGFIGGIGMLICWLTTYLFSPPLGILLDSFWKVKPYKSSSALIDTLFGYFSNFTMKFWKLILVITVVASIIAAFIFNNFIHDPFEYDTTKLRSSDAKMDGGYLKIDSKAESILRHNILPMVILLKNPNDVQSTADNFKKLITPNSILGDVFTMQSLVPDNQIKKLEVLKTLASDIPLKKRRFIHGKMSNYLNQAITASELPPFTMNELPEVVRQQFREKDGSEGNLVLLFPKYGTETKDGRVVLNFANEVRSVKLPDGAVLAGSHLVFADMLSAISHDGPVATLLSFLAVIILSLWLTRGGISGSFVMTFSLLIGVLWTVALASLSNMKINFLNFIALPITFGVGLDYAINVYGRYQISEQTRAGLKLAISKSGSAVTVCSCTTIIGYMSLLFSKNGALYSFGTLAIGGEVACLVAALMILPAMMTSRIKK